MAGWQDITADLTLNIVSQADDWRGLTLTSRQLHAMSEPFMYRWVNLHKALDTSAWVFESVRTLRFLRTLAMRPELGAYVHTLRLSWGETGPLWTLDASLFTADSGQERSLIGEMDWTEDPEADMSFITQISQRVGIPEHVFYGEKTSHTALIAAVLHHVPRLHSLYFFGIQHLGVIPTMIALGMVPGGVPAAFTSVVRIEMLHSRSFGLPVDSSKDGWLSWQSVLPFIMLPNVKSCTFEGIADDVPEIQLAQRFDSRLAQFIIPNASGVEELYFNLCNIPIDGLQTLLSLPRVLREFAYTSEYALMPDVYGWNYSQYPPLAGMLRVHAETMTSLELRSPTVRGGPLAEGALGSLTGFPRLEYLEIDFMALYNAGNRFHVAPGTPTPLQTLLPSSLVTLEIYLDELYTLPVFMSLTGCPDSWMTSKDLLPNLELFSIFIDASAVTREEADRSAARFAMVGIGLDYTLIEG